MQGCKGKSGKEGIGKGEGTSDSSKRGSSKREPEMSVLRFDWTQPARLLEVSCVSEQLDIPTCFEHRWTVKETQSGRGQLGSLSLS